MKILIFLRHREACLLFNELTDKGLADAKVLAEELREKFREEFASKAVGVFTSHAGRTRETAKIMTEVLGIDVEPVRLTCMEERPDEYAFAQGLGAHLPNDIDVAFCVGHEPLLKELTKRFETMTGVTVDVDTEQQITIATFDRDTWLPNPRRG